MQRTKQQAIMFLLGAVLVGSVLGFSAERVLDGKRGPKNTRGAMFQDLDLTAAQQQRIDSLLDAANCQRKAVLKTVQPQLDSLRRETRQQMDAVLTPAQRERLERRRAEEESRHQRRDHPRRSNPCP